MTPKKQIFEVLDQIKSLLNALFHNDELLAEVAQRKSFWELIDKVILPLAFELEME